MDILFLIIGLVLGYAVAKIVLDKTLKGLKEQSKLTLEQAHKKADRMLSDAESKFINLKKDLHSKELSLQKELDAKQNKLLNREKQLEDSLENIEKQRSELQNQLDLTNKSQERLNELLKLQDLELEKVAGLSKEQALHVLFEKIKTDNQDSLTKFAQSLLNEAEGEALEKSKSILALAMQKSASEIASENTSTTVELPSDEMKGRIIGKEGRNIQAFERATGVDVVVDDTPGVVLISGFDLKRRYIAKISLERLVVDGRIHPARIEEVVLKVQDEVEELIDELGEKAAYKAQVAGLPPELINLLGRLKFRTSNGQNVLKQSVEVASIASVLASELKGDVNFCKRAGLLNSIGKAVNHEVAGSYNEIGADIVKKYGLSKKLAECILNYLDPKESDLETVIINIAYNLVCSRPGIGKNNFETYVSRLTELENVALSFDQVQEAYAINNGNTVRVLVNADVATDLDVVSLSLDIAAKIETDMQYSGQVKVHVIREKRLEAVAE